jgi:UDP-N-acetyl-D-glucosamine dehydrogenase
MRASVDLMEKSMVQNPIARKLYQKITERTARPGVIGLGYVGLPLAVELGRNGFEVVGIDLDLQRCDSINRGESYIGDVANSVVTNLTGIGRLRAVPNIGNAGQLDTITICVPTPLRKTRDPDLSHIVAATESIKTHLHEGMLVILESTTYPGTTEEVVQPIIEDSGLRAGKDFFLAFSPERVDPGSEKWNITNVPKVVGGLTPDCSMLAAALYASVAERVVTVSSPRVAEMVKLLENTFRAVNIGLANELALMCDRIGINVWEVIGAAATKPFGFMPFYPGPGLGGHCIPVDPFYLSWKVREVGFEARFIDLAGRVNGEMPHHVVDKISDALNAHEKPINGSKILVMGVAYKAEVNDVRESPALDVIGLLLAKGAHVAYHDPFVPEIVNTNHIGVNLRTVSYNLETVGDADCVVILTDHKKLDYSNLLSAAKLVVDTRNVISGPAPNLFKVGAPNPAPPRVITESERGSLPINKAFKAE